MVIMPGGNVGIGSFNDFPTITDKLQVFGDIRVGTTGTNGCVKNFDGTGLVGTCASDRRFKKDITPFGRCSVSSPRCSRCTTSGAPADFPERHFGDTPRLRLDRAGRRGRSCRNSW